MSYSSEGFTALSSRIEDGVCYVNLAGGALPAEERQRTLLLDALEDSLLSLGGVEQVQFLIEGETAAEPPR